MVTGNHDTIDSILGRTFGQNDFMDPTEQSIMLP